MNIDEAIKIIEEYNKWRRGAGTEMLDPKKIGEALDTVVCFYKSNAPIK